MFSRRRSITFFVLVAFSLTQVAWWCYYQVRRSGQLADAAHALQTSEFERVPSSFGATTAADLLTMAESQRRMFLLEGITFAVLILVAAGIFWLALRREDALRRSQDRFLAGATHELKTPLATLRLGLESLSDERVPAETRQEYVDGLLPEVDRLSLGIDNVLSASGLRGTRRPTPQLVTADLREDVLRAIDAIRTQSKAQEIAIEFEDGAPCIVQRDATAIRIVLHNLLDNAVKYSKSGDTCRVSLSIEDDRARLTVEDEGRGMTADELKQAFDPFWRGRDDHVGGAGLGLHLVRELVRAHDGTVDARSDGDGHGSTFVVRIPLASTLEATRE